MCFEFYEPLLFHASVCCMALLIVAQCFFLGVLGLSWVLPRVPHQRWLRNGGKRKLKKLVMARQVLTLTALLCGLATGFFGQQVRLIFCCLGGCLFWEA